MTDPRRTKLADELMATAAAVAAADTDLLDLKIATAALAEMGEAFAMFAPYKHEPKVTVFGSARTRTDDPLYCQARDVAARLAKAE